ncbi:MAG: glycoside hydrolase family 28 protein [Bacteroidaceae bacterium]|nr:glycoside hydrolase family 28 protein [Bacteroidaceae bacterium]
MKKLFSLLLLFCILEANAQDQKNYDAYYTNLPVQMQKAVLPVFPDYEVNINAYGAKGDGLTLCTEAIQRAIDEVSKHGGGKVVVPDGVFLTAPITLKSNVNLYLSRNAILMSTPNKKLHLDPKNPKGRCLPLIAAQKAENIAITGHGTIDGNGAYWRPVKRGKVSDTEWNVFKAMGGEISQKGDLWLPFNLKGIENIAETALKEESMRQDIFRISKCKKVLLQGVTIQNSPRFHVHPLESQDIILDGITVRCPWNAQNGDAIDLSNCQRCLVVNSIVDAGDDGICMKGGTGQSGVEKGACKDILIQDNTVYHAHGGFVIGSDVSGGMENIVVRSCRFSSTDIGLRFKSGLGRGGYTKNIFCYDIVMSDITDDAICFECTYIDKTATYQEGSYQKPETLAFAPDFQDIHINNIVCRGCKNAIRSVGLEGLECVKNINISNSSFFYLGKDINVDAYSKIDIKNCKFEGLK